MSIPSLTNSIIQPQNIVINQVPLTHAIMPTVNANNGIPIATALTSAVEPSEEIKTSIVVGTIPIAGANIVGVQTVPVQSTSPVKPVQAIQNMSENLETLPKSRLADLIRDIDPNLTLEDEVEELILNYVDEFIDRVLKGACLIAKHRQGNGTIEVKDVQQFLNRNYNIWTPGFGTDELKPYKRNLTTDAHKQRLALIRKAIKKY